MATATVAGGFIRTIAFDRSFAITRRAEWFGPVEFKTSGRAEDPLLAQPPQEQVRFDGDERRDRGPGDDLLGGPPIKLGFPRLPPEPETDSDLLGGGPIELTPKGPRQPGKPRPEPPVPEPDKGGLLDPDKPIELDPFAHIPAPFPLPTWMPDITLDPLPEPVPDFFSTWDPCDVFHPLGPFGPFVEPPDEIELILPRIPGMGPYQWPLEQAVAEGLREFLKEVGKAADAGTIHGEDWEKAGRSAAQKAGKALWDYIRDRIERRYFGGDFSFESVCGFARERPWVTGLGVLIGLSGYGLFLGSEFKRKGRLKLDFGDLEFEYDGETGEWSAGFRFKFKF